MNSILSAVLRAPITCSRMLSAVALTALSLTHAAPALAQTPTALVGTWKVNWEASGRPVEATLVINDTGGSWRTYAHRRQNPCVGLEHPIEVTAQGDKEAVITMRGSQALQGCPDFKVTMKLSDSNNGTGRRGDLELTFVRR